MNPSKHPMKPMSVEESVFLGIVIASLGVTSFYFIRPQFAKAGMGEYGSYLFSLSGVFVVMLLWSILAFLREGNQIALGPFLQRVRLNRLVTNWWAWSVGLGILMFLATVIFSPVLAQLISRGVIPLPRQIPDYVNPLRQQSIASVKAQFVSEGIILLVPMILTLNILGEEIFWRGMVLPRQELRHGKNAFWVHGVIWASAHLFQYWLLAPILIGSIALAYVIQRTRCTWIGIIGHALNNGIPFIIMAFVS